ncbi:hypothetical protein JJB99_00640 [Bradyrhizobium diazoefficiens]|uniref:hypothetical protein n=1 Tax=Bradyrhizobium diazoefficiens TaxID=1355477 RepID=UPI00190E2AD7|nr:hypothetical protein [Bradyrhizobium diazoefficiens]QQO14743.1 hypothetical protein JJB99_00640 [Bradyrhizobium diazoefficiens]
MKSRTSLLSLLGLATAGWLVFGIGTASAQTIYVDPYPAVLPPAPAYVIRRAVIEAPAPVVRERTVVVSRPIYVPAPVYRAPLPRYGYVGDVDYLVPGW